MEIAMQLLGRLHPLLVHLPIGFIIFGLLLQWYDRERKEHLKVLSLIYYWAGISAVVACITGYLQYLGEGYVFDTVKWHLWSGIATAVFSFLMYAKLKMLDFVRYFSKIPVSIFSILILLLISFTGHQGGNITHGEDYLTEPLPNAVKSVLGIETFEEKTIALNDGNWEGALFYEDVIKPILNNKCISCHGPKKSKGELELHTPDAILKGGEGGEIIVDGNPEKSPLYASLVLPKENEDHMPPKDKSQPTKEEIELVKTWLSVGNPFDKSIGELGLSKSLFSAFFPQKINNDFPPFEIPAANEASIKAVKEFGVHVDPISKNSNYLSISCINKPSFADSDFDILLPLGPQIAKLDLGGTRITDAILKKLVQFQNLTILKLDNTEITGKTIELLRELEHLKSINLANSKFEASFLSVFSSFKNLKKVYLFNTNVDGSGVQLLKNGQITIDYGDYQLPQIAADSIIY